MEYNRQKSLPTNGTSRKSIAQGGKSRLPKIKQTQNLPSFTTAHSKFSTTFTMSAPGCTNEDNDEELKSWHDWVGSRVCISGTKLGTLRYFGKTHFAEGSWCGVELDEAVGKNNGTVKDVRYFTCKANFGIFAPLSKTEKITDVSHKIPLPVSNKSKLPQSKNKLKFTPLQSEIPKPLNETICLHNTKSHLPYYQNNANDPKTNINEVYKKHRKSEGFLEKKSEPDLYRFNNNNNSPFELGHLKIAERRTSTPVANPFRKHSSEQMIDFLNKTVTLDINGKISYSNQESFAVMSDNSILNMTFDLSKIPPLDNAVGRKENTLVFPNTNISSTNYPKRLSEGCIDSEEDPKSSELEESLGILSPSQMKDFTLSFDNNIGTTIQMSPKIRKIESCDDVNEIPEFEENKTSEVELLGRSPDMLINNDSEKSVKDINPNVQIFDLLRDIVIPEKGGDNAGDQDDNTKPKAECLNTYHIENLTPKRPNTLKDSFIDLYHIEDANLNVSPSATSTPTFTPFKLSKVPFIKPRKYNLISSDVHSPFTEQDTSLTSLNQTFNHDFFEQNLPEPKMNVISKHLNDLDQISEKVSDTIANSLKEDSPECELSAASQCIGSDSYEPNSSGKDIIDNITADISGSNAENEQLVLSETIVLSNFILSNDDEQSHDISKPGNCETLEKKNKMNSFHSEIISNSKCVLDIAEDVNLISETSSVKNENAKLDKLWDTNMEESVYVENAICHDTTNPVLDVTLHNVDNAVDPVTFHSFNETHSLQFTSVSNSTSTNDELINANIHTVLSEIPVDLHLEEGDKKAETCDSQLCQADETILVASNDNTFVKNKRECLIVSSREKGDFELEDENTNKLSETFSCSTLKELDNFETMSNEFHTEESDVESRVLDVTMTVMQIDNLNVTVNIDQLNQASNGICNKSDSTHSESTSKTVLNNECLLLDNAKKSNDVKIVPLKPPKKNVISKIKSMLESDKSSTGANQENQKSKHSGMSQKKMGKWDTVTSKIAAGLADNKKKVKKEVTSRVNTNLNASRQVIPKTPQPLNVTKFSKSNVNRKPETGNKSIVPNNLKNSSDNKMVCEDSKSAPSTQRVVAEKDLRILVQLQNVDCEKKQQKNSKVNFKKKGFGLFSKTTSVSRSNSLSSDCSQTSLASKNVLHPKISTPVQTKVLNGSKKALMTPKIDAGLNKKATPGKSEIGKIIPRRNNTLPKAKQYSRPKPQKPQ